MNVPVPGRILSIPIRETIHPFQSIYALGAVMNKLLRIIFSVLKSKQAFRVITPDEQVQLYQKSQIKAA